MINKILPFLLTIAIFIGLSYFIKPEHVRLLSKLDFLEILVALILALAAYATSGIQYFYIRKKYIQRMDRKDIILLPVLMNLWSFIIPFQGSLLFSSFYFKTKYKITLTDSLSINLYLYLVTVFFAGATGLIFAIFNNMTFSALGFISLIFTLSPLCLFILHYLHSFVPAFKINFLVKIQSISDALFCGIRELFLNWETTLIVLLLNILRTIICAIWFYWLALSVGLPIPLIAVILLSLMMDVAIIIKFTPDNLGVSQVIAGIITSLSGLTASTGIIISLLSSATALLIIGTVGVVANYFYIKSFNLASFKDFLSLLNHKT